MYNVPVLQAKYFGVMSSIRAFALLLFLSMSFSKHIAICLLARREVTSKPVWTTTAGPFWKPQRRDSVCSSLCLLLRLIKVSQGKIIRLVQIRELCDIVRTDCRNERLSCLLRACTQLTVSTVCPHTRTMSII